MPINTKLCIRYCLYVSVLSTLYTFGLVLYHFSYLLKFFLLCGTHIILTLTHIMVFDNICLQLFMIYTSLSGLCSRWWWLSKNKRVRKLWGGLGTFWDCFQWIWLVQTKFVAVETINGHKRLPQSLKRVIW